MLSILLKRDFGALLKAERDFLILIEKEEEEERNLMSDSENSIVSRLLRNVNNGNVNGNTATTSSLLGNEGNDESETYDSLASIELDIESKGWWPNAVVPFSVIVLVTFAGKSLFSNTSSTKV